MSAVPKLRFPEFDDYWASEYLSYFAEIIDGDRGKNYPKNDDYFDEEFCLFLSAKNVTRKGFVFDVKQFITKEKDFSLSKGKLQRGDIVLTARGTVGNFAYFDANVPFEHARVNSGMVLLRSKKTIDPLFLYVSCSAGPISSQVKVIAFGSAQPQLTVKDIKRFRVAAPSLPEQQKIASFLSSVDKKIDLLRQKKGALELYKKGLMQKIFSQEVRFKADDGSDFPDWEEVSLGDIAQITTGTGNREDSQEAGKYLFFDRSTDVRWSNNYEFDHEAIIVSGEGKSFPPRYFAGKFGLHQRAYAIYNFKDANAKFIFYMISLRRDFFLKMSVGSTMPSLRMNAFTYFPISLPSPVEQQKIASFLSAIDSKIQQTSSQIEQMETFKKGLLQQMFV